MPALRRLAAAAAAVCLSLAPLGAYAVEDYLYTSSVSYCAPPNTLLIEKFDISYFKQNNSVSFDVVAASVSSVNVTANLLVNTYGMRPLNVTLDLCNILGGALCPLPKYQFNGTDSITISSFVDVSDYVPGIAYKIPDLEAYAQLKLTEIGTGDTVACIQATLSNGLSTHQSAVEWATGGLAFLALASALWQWFIPESLAPVRLLDLVGLYQTIASSGLLSLNYPIVYRNFALNFAWSLGLFRSSNIQHSINNMRALTGGDNKNGTSNAVGLVNRKLSPYNSPVESLRTFVAPQALIARVKALPTLVLNHEGVSGNALIQRRVLNTTQLASAGEVQTYSPSTDEVLEAGLPIYTNSLDIATANALMTVFLISLILFAITLGVFGVLYGITRMLQRKYPTSQRFKDDFPSFCRAWGLRVILVCYAPVTLFAFFQWTLKDSWLSIILSVILWLFILGSISASVFFLVRTIRRSSPAALDTNGPEVASYRPLFTPYRTPRWYFFGVVLAAILLRSLFIAVVKSGKVQVILVLVLEILLLAATIVLRPHHTRGSDVFASYLSICRVVAAGLMIAFIESLEVKAIPRVVIGIVIAIIFSVCVVVMFFNICCHLGLIRFFRRRSADEAAAREASGSASMLEKGGAATPDAMPAAFLPHVGNAEEGRSSLSLDSPHHIQERPEPKHQ